MLVLCFVCECVCARIVEFHNAGMHGENEWYIHVSKPYSHFATWKWMTLCWMFCQLYLNHIFNVSNGSLKLLKIKTLSFVFFPAVQGGVCSLCWWDFSTESFRDIPTLECYDFLTQIWWARSKASTYAWNDECACSLVVSITDISIVCTYLW